MQSMLNTGQICWGRLSVSAGPLSVPLQIVGGFSTRVGRRWSDDWLQLHVWLTGKGINQYGSSSFRYFSASWWVCTNANANFLTSFETLEFQLIVNDIVQISICVQVSSYSYYTSLLFLLIIEYNIKRYHLEQISWDQTLGEILMSVKFHFTSE